LSPYLHQHRDIITDWGYENCSDIYESFDDYISDDDFFYIVSQRYFSVFPELMKERMAYDSSRGIITLEEKEYTGITIQLFDIPKLRDIGCCDNFLLEALTGVDERKHKHLLVNVDFAFGEQAQHVLRSMLLTFGRSTRSVSVMGKAGGLLGSRGDILFPTHFIHEQGDLPDYRSVDNSDIDINLLHEMSCVPIHVGPVVTIPGTLLQNRELLRFYKMIWVSIGIEMEGTYFEEALNQARLMGIVGENIKSRYLYYVSDLPLSKGTTLAKPMTLSELIPSMYAISRILIWHVLDITVNQVSIPSPVSTTTPPTSKKDWHEKLHRVANVCRAITRFKVGENKSRILGRSNSLSGAPRYYLDGTTNEISETDSAKQNHLSADDTTNQDSTSMTESKQAT
jgi:hypothetical protein